ncbi:RdgB/HAM1 family non-canonical purine NTP pyrophosphatase [Sorangium sp. So ce327]|uniref:RdgB/HAM1 family non-canonical purine NTP pyrophosphatase n=1 Tax=Sorangium sp. So ce327 TaxID=3133301 RepID=UPI003F5F5863
MSLEPLRLLAATSNRGKLVELRSLLSDLPIEVLSLADVLPGAPPVVEDGATFLDNALLKVRAGALRSAMVTLAEDSGLEVDALDGRPGVRSARFAREGATDAENNEALLAALADVADDRRRARFRCVMVLLDPRSEAQPIVTEGRCEGWIGRQPRGAGGFGYDPLFVVEGYGRTMAELGEAEKNLVSHRGKAAREMRSSLEALVARR